MRLINLENNFFVIKIEINYVLNACHNARGACLQPIATQLASQALPNLYPERRSRSRANILQPLADISKTYIGCYLNESVTIDIVGGEGVP